MGANAQTSVPAFTAGQVLTAAQMTQVNTGIPVFASSTERDAAFGGTGEKTLAEGQMAYLEDTNETQVYDGAAWAALAAGGGLVVVKTETAFSAVSSVTADNVFTSDYTNYLVSVTYSTSSTQPFYYKLRASGTSTSSNYNGQRVVISGSSTTPVRVTGGTAEFAGFTTGSTSYKAGSQLVLYGPQLAEKTVFFNNNSQNEAGGPIIGIISGYQSDATAFDGIELLVTTGTFTGTYTIYGFAQ